MHPFQCLSKGSTPRSAKAATPRAQDTTGTALAHLPDDVLLRLWDCLDPTARRALYHSCKALWISPALNSVITTCVCNRYVLVCILVLLAQVHSASLYVLATFVSQLLLQPHYSRTETLSPHPPVCVSYCHLAPLTAQSVPAQPQSMQAHQRSSLLHIGLLAILPNPQPHVAITIAQTPHTLLPCTEVRDIVILCVLCSLQH